MKEKNNRQKITFFSDNKKKIIIGLAVAGVLVFVASFFMFRESLCLKKSEESKYFFLNPAVSLMKKENMIVNFQLLREELQKKYENREDFLISLYFEYLPTGSNITINKDEKIWPASLIKIPVAMAAMKKVSDGKWKLSNELVILDEDKDSDFGTMYNFPTGTPLSVREFLEKSLVDSDNTAHFVLLRNLDSEEIEDVYTHLGLDDIIDAIKKTPKGAEVDNKMTAKRYSVFFRSLYNATFLDPQHSQLFLDILEKAPKEYLNLGIPENVRFVHKTEIRVDDNVRADTGIVYVPDRPYLLTVMLQKKNHVSIEEGEAEKIFESISKEIYDYVSKAE